MTKAEINKLKEGDVVLVEYGDKCRLMYFRSFGGISVHVTNNKDSMNGALVPIDKIHKPSDLQLELI